MEYSFTFYLYLRSLLLEFVAIPNIPLCEKVILDPKNFSESLDNRSFLFELESGMREDSLDQYVLDEAKKDANVDVFDVERVFSSLPNMPMTGG